MKFNGMEPILCIPHIDSWVRGRWEKTGIGKPRGTMTSGDNTGGLTKVNNKGRGFPCCRWKVNRKVGRYRMFPSPPPPHLVPEPSVFLQRINSWRGRCYTMQCVTAKPHFTASQPRRPWLETDTQFAQLVIIFSNIQTLN